MKYLFLIIFSFIVSSFSFAEVQTLAEAQEGGDQETTDLSNFGFGPAFFMISYKEEILEDSKDVRVRGDGAIDASGSKYGTAVGLEVHYDFSLWGTRKGYKDSNSETKWTHSNGVVLSPFLGLYDIDNGINGLAAGVLFGYWKGDENFQNRTSLNFGLGYTVHRDRLVLSRGVSEGIAPPSGLQVEDYTTRKDVEGIIAMVSVSVDF